MRSQTLKADGCFPASDSDDDWWVRSGQSFFAIDAAEPAAEWAQARQHFFLPRRYRDPFGQATFVDLDTYDLLTVETRDPLGNHVTANANDYRVLQPRLVSDPNRNQTEVAFDALGMVVGTAVMGKTPPAPAEGDTLTDFITDLTQPELDAFFSAGDPHTTGPTLLGNATTRIVYDLDRFSRTRQANPDDPTTWQPACAATLARETHSSVALPPQGLKIHVSVSYSDGFGREIQKKIQAEPGPLIDRGSVASPRWVASGWTIFNNKGKPVREYEPFFSASHNFEFGVQVGVSPIVFYDPAERVIATLHPNHTFDKVVFDAWRQTTWDANDSCTARNAQTGDPRTDPDIAGYVANYFKAMGAEAASWETWHAQRVSGALGSDERNGALRAQAHADTPTTAHFDARGRAFLTVAENRVVCADHDLDGTEESLATRVEFDIEGNQLVVSDERRLPINYLPVGGLEQRTVMRYAYDMLGNRVSQISMDGGGRWTLNDVLGRGIQAWDSRGHNFSTTYDALRRPVKQTVRGTTAESDPGTLNRDITVERIEYGETLANSQALNLHTRIYRHFDSAGVTINARLNADDPSEAYDFKGNLLYNTRRLARDYTAIPDWSLPHEPQLEPESFEGSTRYDALNRPIQSIAPRSSLTRADHPNSINVIQPVFNEAKLLDRVDVWLELAVEPAALLDPRDVAPSPVGITNIDYDAKGQRQRIDYRNGAATLYSYDPLTFRLTQLLTQRDSATFADDDPQPPNAGWPGRYLRNLHYTYDPVGNITHIRDDAQQTVYFRNRRVEPGNDYTYDAQYRLIQASGREHLGQTNGAPNPPASPDALNAFHARLDHPGDGKAMGNYVERYVYDAAGNFLQMQHRGTDPAHAGWARAYDYVEPSRIEDGTGGTLVRTSNRLSRTTLNPNGSNPPEFEPYQHDVHGNMVRMPHLGDGQPRPNIQWDYRDHMRNADLGGGGRAYYAYDASGRRVRKVWQKAPGLTEERIYLGGTEIFRRHSRRIGANSVTLERETLHVTDDKQRVALVETRSLDSGRTDQAPRQLVRYTLSNHLGSTALELDQQQQIVSYEEYAPYGSSTYQAVRSQTEGANRYRHTGQERDEESGCSLHGVRYYAPWIGRWTSCDPSGLNDGVNPYIYVHDKPVTEVDLTGQDGQPWWRFTEAGFQYQTGKHDIFRTDPGYDTGFAPANFVVNLVVTASNLCTVPFNAVTEAAAIPEEVARWLGASEQDIEAMNFALMMTGVGEVNALSKFARSARAFERGAAVATELKNARMVATDLKNAGAVATEVKNTATLAAELKNTGMAATEVKNTAAVATELKNTASAATEVKNAASMVRQDIALGMQASSEGGGPGQLQRFSEAVRAASMNAWERLGLVSNVPAERFDLAFKQVMERTVASGGKIHFDLTGLDVAAALAGDPGQRVGRYTAWELQQISQNASWLEKTIFYRNGQALAAKAVEALGIGVKR